MVLVGIGEAFQESFSLLDEGENQNISFLGEYARMKYLDSRQENEIDHAYRKLKGLLEEKNYFIVSLCNDDLIYGSGLCRERIVTPCGSYHQLQCENVCNSEIYDIEGFAEEIDSGRRPICPHCGKNLVFNHIGIPKYSEEGYLKQWEIYHGWLQESLNKKLLILELGVGMKYPSVIRWPAEKITFINKKAKLIRVHSFLYQIPEELKEKGIAVQEEPITFLLNQIV